MNGPDRPTTDHRSLPRLIAARHHRSPAMKPTYRIIVVSGPDHGAQIEPTVSSVTIGREDGCGFVLTDTSVSRRHIEIVRAGGVVILRDLGSANGTLINGAAVAESQRLGSGDRIVIGTTELLFVDTAPLDAARASDAETKRFDHDRLVGDSEPMQELGRLITRVAPSDATVLVMGESGTGKELVAHAIHSAGPRALKPFVTVNAPAIPESLIESELFGHERGAFTGADRRTEGAFARAADGTLFLDELGELPLGAQAKLLRVLENRTFSRVGSSDEQISRARVIAATNRDLTGAVAAGRFREDLFYRLSVIRIAVPPLRDRREDIAALVPYFVRAFARKERRPRATVDPDTLAALARHDWPGNVRQLRNAVHHAVLLGSANVLGDEDFRELLERPSPPESASRGETARLQRPELAPAPASPETTPPTGSLSLMNHEKALIIRALAQAGGNKSRAAKLLSIARNTLYKKMKRLGIADPSEGE